MKTDTQTPFFTKTILVGALPALVLLIAGCGSRGDTGSVVGSIISPFCAAVSLGESAGRPLDEIRILGLDATQAERPVDELFGLYRPKGSDEEIPVPARLDENAAAALVVPPHPAGIGGGAGTLRLTDGKGLGCPELVLDVEAIPSAPGTTRLVAEQLGELIRARTASYGFDPDRLTTTPIEELPLIVLPQAMALWALEGSDNADSPRTELQETGTGGLLDALLAHAEVPRELDAEIAETRQRIDSTGASRVATVGSGLRRVAAPRQATAGRSLMAAFGTLALLQSGEGSRSYTRKVLDIPPVSIRNAQELSKYMRAQAAASRTLSGAAGKLPGTAISVIGIWAPGIGTAASTLHFVYQKSRESDLQLLPCCFKSIEYETEKPYFEEDYEFPPEHANWRQVKVVAHNLGWNLTQTAIESAEAVLGAGKGFKAARKSYAARKAGGRATEEISGDVRIGDFLEGKAKGRAKGRVKTGLPDIRDLTVPPFTWPPIDITHAQWSDGEAEGAIRRISTHGYAPEAVGVGKLTVETLRGRFGNAHKALSKLVEVREIVVSVTPSVRRVEPGETIEMRAFVRDSLHPEELEWRFESANGVSVKPAQKEYLGAGAHLAKLTLPNDERAFPIEVEAESTSRTGLRRSGTPRRYGSATLTAGVVVEIGPQPACVEKGEELQMWAEVIGANDTRVSWRVRKGPARFERRRDGVLVATGDGEVTVRGTSIVDENAFDEAVVDVGRCTCMVSAILSGDTMKTNAQGGVAHFSTEGKTTIMGGFSNPGVIEDVMEMFGGMLGEEAREQAEEWKHEMSAMPRETLGIALSEMDPGTEGEQLLAAAFGGFSLQASVMNEPIEPGFAGGLPLSHVMLTTGEYSEGGYPAKYEWAPGAPGNVRLIVSHYNGRSLSGTITGNMFAPGLYKESSGEPPQVSFSVSFYALELDPLNLELGCLAP